MDFPISYLVEYTPLDFHGRSFETSIRHIPEYNTLLTKIEDKSKQLGDVLKQLRMTCPTNRLNEYARLESDYEYFTEELVHRPSSYEYGEYCRAMMDTICKHMDIIDARIRPTLDKPLCAMVHDLHEEIWLLMDEKYNEHDKYYMD